MSESTAPTPPSTDFLSRVTRAQRSLYAFILTLVRQPADAEDVLQETNVVLWQKAAEFDAMRDFLPWALRIAQLQAMAHLKRQKRVPITFDEPLLGVLADEAIAEAGDLDVRRQDLAGCLQRLPERQRELIATRYEPGGSVNELAHRSGKTPGRTQAIGQEAELRAGASIHVVGLASLAVLRLDDGTEISLAGETRIDFHRQGDQTSLTLHEGHLSANVTHQATERPLLIHTPGAEMQILGTRFAVSADDETSELGVRHGRVLLKRLTDGETVDVFTGQYAVVSQRAALEARPWPKTPETWSEDFENGLPDGWRYGQWLRDGPAEDSRGVVLAARRFALDGSESELHRITLPKRWMEGLWRLEEDTHLHFTYKMSRPGWFHIMMGVRSDDLNASHVGNYELQSSFWKKGKPDQWQTVSVPFSAFRENIRSVPYADLPPTSPRAGDVVYLLWFNTGDVDRGLMFDRIWVDRSSQPSEEKREQR